MDQPSFTSRFFVMSIVARAPKPIEHATLHSLSGWMNTLIDYVRSGEPDLTNRQMALLLVVYLQPGPHTVRGLARSLQVSKPVITRALNRLGSLGYLRRQRDESDKRNIYVVRTAEGAEFLEQFEHFIGT